MTGREHRIGLEGIDKYDMDLKETLKKQGGMKLLEQYWRGSAFFTAVGGFLLLGKSRTALEILRLCATLKIKQKLERKYGECLERFDETWVEKEHSASNKVWICWFQGIENAPTIVQKCYRSVMENMPDKEIILITSENMSDYVKFPDHIMDKWEKGLITLTHMTDLLRLELLIKYGGLWLDATVFCSGKDIPDHMVGSDLFFFQCLKPGRDGHSSYISSWLMSAKSNNKILMATRALIYAYWKDHDTMWDYFLLHDFMSIVLDRYPEAWKKVVPRDNAAPHILLLRLFDPYDEQMWDAIRSQTPFHKMTYKFDAEQEKQLGTYYDVLFR